MIQSPEGFMLDLVFWCDIAGRLAQFVVFAFLVDRVAAWVLRRII